jgi:hypothetical protein
MEQVFDGIGTLYEGTRRLGEAHYRLERTAPALRGGIWRTSGQIVGGDVDLASLIARRDTPTLTLHLGDGVRWECRLSDSAGTLTPVGRPFYRIVDGARMDLPN